MRLATFIGTRCTRLSRNPEDHGIECIPAEFGSNPSGGRGRAPPGGAQMSVGPERGGGSQRAVLSQAARRAALTGRRESRGEEKSQGGLGCLGLSASRPPGRVRLFFSFPFFLFYFSKPFSNRILNIINFKPKSHSTK